VLRGGEHGQRLIEAPLEQVPEAVVRHAAESRHVGTRRQVIAVDGREEEERADPLVEVRLAAAIPIELGARGEQVRDRASLAPAVDGLVACRRIGRVDEVGDPQPQHGATARPAPRRGHVNQVWETALAGGFFGCAGMSVLVRADGQELDQLREHAIAVAARERERQLRVEQPVAGADVVAAPVDRQRQIALPRGERVQRG
jgi:hypothetical protein